MPKAPRDLPVIAFSSRSRLLMFGWRRSRAIAGVCGSRSQRNPRGIASISRAEAVDSALCHGWIDGQLDSFDGDYWLIRFTPRQFTSKWSEINRARAQELVGLGRMRSAGLKEIERAKKDGRWDAAYAAQSTAQVPDDLARALAKSKKAKAFFETLDSKNRFAILYRVHSAKKPETRTARIEKFVALLVEGETLYPLGVQAQSGRRKPRKNADGGAARSGYKKSLHFLVILPLWG
jgi:uncharacterized protein YdeI (YjbR/CyaY-like superfamily)